MLDVCFIKRSYNKLQTQLANTRKTHRHSIGFNGGAKAVELTDVRLKVEGEGAIQ
jgi:hypothetical protein